MTEQHTLTVAASCTLYCLLSP